MNKRIKLELIREAQKRLIENPRDLFAHDITHLHRVAQLALLICKNIEEKPDEDIVEIVAWWHDVDIKEELSGDERIKDKTAEYLSSKFEGDEEMKIFEAINNHEFGSRPTLLEGKILYDADKVELVSLERIKNIREAIEAGLMNIEEAKRIVNVVLEKWYPVIPNLLHFDYSRNLFNQGLPEAIKSLKEIVNK